MHDYPGSPPPKPRRAGGRDASPSAYRVASPREYTRAPALIAETDAFLQMPASRSRRARRAQLFFAAAASLSCLTVVAGMFLAYLTDAKPLTFLDVVAELWVQSLVIVAVLVAAVAVAASLCRPGGYSERSAATAIAGAGAVIACGRIVDLAAFGIVAALGQDASVGPGLWTMLGGALVLFGVGAMARSNATYGWADDSSASLWRTVWAQGKAAAAGRSRLRRPAARCDPEPRTRRPLRRREGRP